MDDSEGVQVTVAHGVEGVRAAAAIWAHAKARRDQEPVAVEDAVPGIRRRLEIDGATLLLASQDGHPVGFTLFAPRAGALEIFYLAVDPAAWGGGVGSHLLRSVEEHARAGDTLELWVIDDNERAVRVYERSGWVGTEEVQRSSGRLERRFLKRV